MDFETASAAIDMLGALFGNDPKRDDAAAAVLGSLADMDVEALAADWPFVDADTCAPLLRRLQEGALGDSDELAKDYRRLFVGPNALKAPPYGSVYTDPDQVLFGASTLELRSWLDEVGIGVDNDEVAPEDHIATMLSLAAWIMRVKPAVLTEYLEKHLLTWAPHYLDELEAAAGDGFYGCLAALAMLTLEGARDQLGLRIEVPRFYR
ncbi:MAG: Tat proofreading chaperone DmsD [Eggerthellaceae bacterium]|nr:Tat proofreading chaperone DmsD [Eggerthellaceae bacterium]